MKKQIFLHLLSLVTTAFGQELLSRGNSSSCLLECPVGWKARGQAWYVSDPIIPIWSPVSLAEPASSSFESLYNKSSGFNAICLVCDPASTNQRPSQKRESSSSLEVCAYATPGTDTVILFLT